MTWKRAAWWVYRSFLAFVGILWLIDAWQIVFDDKQLSTWNQAIAALFTGMYLLVAPGIKKPK